MKPLGGPRLLTPNDAAVKKLLEEAHDHVGEQLPDDWTVTIVASKPTGELFVASDEDDVAELG